ncbi:MAG: hypothetical protein KAH96_00185 [Alphaproteobacteria bacterium]|nr:hypothetical protein [Alphaproteobacteria bacterium]
MIIDFFSHKIHSSSEAWPEKLVELAAIFGEFDGKLFDRNAFEERLQRISPRASYLAQEAIGEQRFKVPRLDVSKFRDEISAYPAYLGLYFLERSPSGWIFRVSETAKRFLLREEPDVAAFLRLQLPLFQYPNAMGAKYTSHTNKLTIQANARDRTLEFLRQGIHLSPVRLIGVALKADAVLRGVDVIEAAVSFGEIYGLANFPGVNRRALPEIDNVIATLRSIRTGKSHLPSKYERRFHTLKHMEIFKVGQGYVRFRQGINKEDCELLSRRLDAICSVGSQFNDFDACTSSQDIEEVISSGKWGRYFDGVMVLPSHVVEALTTDKALEGREASAVGITPEIYPFRERTTALPPVRPYDRRCEMADPELTRIKRQRRNLAHKELIDKMDTWLRRIGARPKENDHIDLFAKIPSDGSFIFEMKSGGESLLEQIRKGLSQLYEYRYRYKSSINDPHISLCLVLPELPDSIPWLVDYLCTDREINICWFNQDGQLEWPKICEGTMEMLQCPP